MTEPGSGEGRTTTARIVDPNPFQGIACRDCGTASLRLEMRLEAKPIGSFSLSGATMKFSASEWPYCVCTHCGGTSRGKCSQ